MIRRRREVGRTAILDAAESAFAARGYHGASLRQLAKQAGVTQSLVHHHFGSKEGLYEAVKHRIAGQLLEESRGHLQPEGPLTTETLTGVIHDYIAFWTGHPDALRIRLWSRLEGDARPWLTDEVMDAYRGWVERAVDSGLVRDDIPVFALMGQTMWLVLGWHMDRATFHASYPEHPALDTEMPGHIVAVLLHGVLRDPPS